MFKPNCVCIRRLVSARYYFTHLAFPKVCCLQDYYCTVEFVRSHFLVKEGIRINAQGTLKSNFVIDRIDKTSGRWKRADISFFITAHCGPMERQLEGKTITKKATTFIRSLTLLRLIEER
ncbi:unnamed protein product [Rhodiola kirilowii]